jgi:predicted nucleotidyltransferase
MNTTVLPPETIEGLPEIVRRLVEHYHPLQVMLFGSQVWGEPDEGSDVDLFVVKETDERFLDRRRTVKQMLYETGRVPFAMDVLVYTPREVEQRLSLGDPFVRDILNGGLLLYESTDARMA